MCGLCALTCVADTCASSDGETVTGRTSAIGQRNRDDQQRAPVADSYDRYYGSGVYDARYPRPNPPTYRYVLRLAANAARILDFGAGSGRYALPVLQVTCAFVCAYDISADALTAAERRASSAGVPSDRLLTTTSLDTARSAGPYNLVLSLFGVLSHIETAAAHGTESRPEVPAARIGQAGKPEQQRVRPQDMDATALPRAPADHLPAHPGQCRASVPLLPVLAPPTRPRDRRRRSYPRAPRN
jgi:SAM-dependent methyltransferase